MSICARCGTAFDCGMVEASASAAPCWCTRLPVLARSAYMPTNDDPASPHCFCPTCLQALLAAAGQSKPGER